MAQFSIRPARPEDCGTILELIRGIAEYEKMSDEVVSIILPTGGALSTESIKKFTK